MLLPHLLPEDLHELLLRLPLLTHLRLGWDDELLRGGVSAGHLWVGVEVVVDELQNEVLVLIEGLNVAVQLQEVGCHLVLQIVELHYFLHLPSHLLELPLGLQEFPYALSPFCLLPPLGQLQQHKITNQFFSLFLKNFSEF